MSQSFMERPCSHCGETITSPGQMETIGDNSVHSRCLSEYVDVTPKMELAPFTCDGCNRSLYTEKGLQRHREREVCP